MLPAHVSRGRNLVRAESDGTAAGAAAGAAGARACSCIKFLRLSLALFQTEQKELDKLMIWTEVTKVQVWRGALRSCP